jgi:putative solute:sodium symporter small subunit
MISTQGNSDLECRPSLAQFQQRTLHGAEIRPKGRKLGKAPLPSPWLAPTRYPLDHMTGPDRTAYWRANLRLIFTILSIWFLVSFGAGIWGREFLDQWRLPGTGFPLGFWFAQQGSILVFVALIAFYVRAAGKLDKRFEVEEKAPDPEVKQ